MSTAHIATSTQHAPGASILVVDDEVGPRESLRMILSPRHHVEVCSGGIDALDQLRTTSVDLVTVDLNMPGMKGDELMRTIREEFPRVEILVITGCGSVETAIEGIRHGVCDYITKPFDVVQVSAAVSRALTRQSSRRRLVSFLEEIGSLLGRDRNVEEVVAEIEQSSELQDQLRSLLRERAVDPVKARAGLSAERTVEFLEVLAETIESRDHCMRGHARRVAFYADLLAERLCLGSQEREHVRISSFLHDIGKVAVSTDVISSRLPLETREREEVERHATLGERLIRPLGFSSGVASAIRHHHERWDGGGYADRLREDEIPLASRIIAVADAFDAMTCDRPYRPALSQQDAIDELRKHAGSQFDPSLVDHFVSIVEHGAVDLVDERASLHRIPFARPVRPVQEVAR